MDNSARLLFRQERTFRVLFKGDPAKAACLLTVVRASGPPGVRLPPVLGSAHGPESGRQGPGTTARAVEKEKKSSPGGQAP